MVLDEIFQGYGSAHVGLKASMFQPSASRSPVLVSWFGVAGSWFRVSVVCLYYKHHRSLLLSIQAYISRCGGFGFDSWGVGQTLGPG